MPVAALSLVPLSLTYSPSNRFSRFPWYTLLSQYFIAPALGSSVVGCHCLQKDNRSAADTPETYQPRTSSSLPHFFGNYSEMLSRLLRSVYVKVWYGVQRSVMPLYLLLPSWPPSLYMFVEHASPIFHLFGSSSVHQTRVTSSQMSSATNFAPSLIISAGILYTRRLATLLFLNDFCHFLLAWWLFICFLSAYRSVLFTSWFPSSAAPNVLSIYEKFLCARTLSSYFYSLQVRFGRIAFLNETCLIAW